MHNAVPGSWRAWWLTGAVLCLPSFGVLLIGAETRVCAGWMLLLSTAFALLALANSVSPRRSLALALPFWLLAPVFVWHWLYFGAAPAPAALNVLAHTNPRESWEFFKTNAGLALASICLLFWSLYAQALRRHLRPLPARVRHALLGAALVVVALWPLAAWMPAAAAQAAWPSGLLTFLRDVGRIEQAPAMVRSGFNATATGGGADVAVLIIGESSRASRYALFGYARDTTPSLDRRAGADAGFYALPRVYATANMTVESVRMLLTGVRPQAFYREAPAGTVCDVFREAGYRLYWLSNNDPDVAADVGVVPDRSVTFNLTNTSIAEARALDASLLPHLDAALAETAPRKLIVLHLAGSHFHYRDRYAASYAHWRGGEADEYDNSISYTDEVLEQVLLRLERHGGSAVALYLSDHGENLRTDAAGLWAHGQGPGTLEEFRVAGFIWASAAWRRANPERAQALRRNSALPFMQEDAMHTLAGTAGVGFRSYDAMRDLGSRSYRARERREVVLNGAVHPLPLR